MPTYLVDDLVAHLQTQMTGSQAAQVSNKTRTGCRRVVSQSGAEVGGAGLGMPLLTYIMLIPLYIPRYIVDYIM